MKTGNPSDLVVRRTYMYRTDGAVVLITCLYNHPGNALGGVRERKVVGSEPLLSLRRVCLPALELTTYKYRKELDTRKGDYLYDYGARNYDPTIGRWHVQDPMAEKYCSWSLYIYCLNNPANFVDMKGKDVWVKNLPNGTYQIVGGTINQDLNIYLVDENENKSNNIVGSTLTPYSFFGDNGEKL